MVFFLISCNDPSKIYTDQEIINIVRKDLNFYNSTFQIYENSMQVKNLSRGKYHVTFRGEYNSVSVYSGLQELQVIEKDRYSSKNIKGVGYNLEL